MSKKVRFAGEVFDESIVDKAIEIMREVDPAIAFLLEGLVEDEEVEGQ